MMQCKKCGYDNSTDTKGCRLYAQHPVRSNFATCSTGTLHRGGIGRTGYYQTKGDAINAFDNALKDYDFHFNPDDSFNCIGNDGRRTFIILDKDDNHVGHAIISWYRMESGNYEFTGYIA